ncbi:MAG: hypothetical protein U0X91_12840 [Spirosomataceae bacterium]
MSGIISRDKARGYNNAFWTYSSLNFSPEIKSLFWENLFVEGEDLRAILSQTDEFGVECKDVRGYPGLRNLASEGDPEQLSFTIILVGVDERGDNMYQKEIILRRTPPGDPATVMDLISDEHEPCKPPPPCPLL